MKITNEAKVGLLAIVAIIVLVLGFSFLKGKKIFSKTPTLYAVFKNLGSLEKSNMVKINGLPVGTVSNLVPADKEVSAIVVQITLTRDILIPKGSVAYIDGSPLGASYISIKKGPGNVYMQAGDTLDTDLSKGLLGDLREQAAPTITRVNETLDSLKLTIGNINNVFDPAMQRNLHTMIAHLAITSASLQQQLNAQTGALAQTLDNMNSVTANLARNNDAITHSIRNVEITTSSLANARIKETVAAMEGTIGELRSAANSLKTSIDKLNNPNGTLGALMNDRKLYDQMNRAALGLEILLDDVRVHPKRYVNISLIGGKTKNDPLTSPSVKDTLPSRKK